MAETEEKIAYKGEDKGKGKENNIEDKSNDKDKGEAEFQQQKMKQNKRRWNHGIKPEMRWNQTSKDNDISTNNKFRELEEKVTNPTGNKENTAGHINEAGDRHQID
ncbi:hypothetical protein P3L10_012537 [Capsicum annuum]